jgi:hypothetical protein
MNKIMLVSLIAFTMSSAQAAQKKMAIGQSIRMSKSSASISTSTYHHKEDGFKFEARPGFGTVNSNFSFGASLEGKYGFNMGNENDLFVGLETGYYHSSATINEFASATANMIPIEPTATFETPVSHNIRLSGGVGLGIAIITAGASLDPKVYGNTTVPSQTSTKFIWSIRPGMILNDTFVATLPLGTVDGSFYFLPSIGARF